jgi:integrase/recombinase XerC
MVAYLGMLQTGRRLSSHTLSNYTRDLCQLETMLAEGWPGRDLLSVDTSVIRRLAAQQHARGLSGRSIARKLSAWRGFYRWAAQQGYSVAANPVDDVRAPKSAKRLPKALSVEYAVALMDSGGADPSAPETLRDLAIYELLYSSGLRLSEIVQLDWRYVEDASYQSGGWLSLDAAEVTVLGKGGKRRTVPVGSKACAALCAWLAVRSSMLKASAPPGDAHALFLGSRGGRISHRTIQQRLKAHALRVGVPANVHPHVLRHSFATHVLQSSGDLRAVQEMLGHASISTTQVYTALDFQHLAKVYDQAHPRAKKKPR